jgi:regulator of sigma E protease
MDSFLPNLLSLLLTIVVTLLIIGLVVFVHELGHFLAARSVGVKVEKFAIGFGPKLFTRQFGETEFSLRLIMLGGFVQMYGDLDPTSSRADETTRGQEDSYLSKNVWQKLWITVAGVVANVIFAAVVFVAFIALTGGTLLLQRIGDYKFIAAEQTEEVMFLTQDFRGTEAPYGAILSIEGVAIETKADLEKIAHAPENYGRELEVELLNVSSSHKYQVILNGAGVASNFDLDIFPIGSAEGRVVLGEIATDKAVGKARLVSISSAGDAQSGSIGGGSLPITSAEGDWDTQKLSGQYLLMFAGKQILSGQQLLDAIDQNLGKKVQAVFIDGQQMLTQVEIELPASKPEEGGVLGVSFGVARMGVNKDAMLVKYASPLAGGPAHAVNSIGYNAYALSLLVSEALSGRPDALAQNVGSVVAIGREVNTIQTLSLTSGAGTLVQFLNLLGVFSAILAFMNILPIPILDGGNVVFIILEALRGKPLPKRVMDVLYIAFFGGLMLLSVLVIGLDIFKLFR